MRAQVLALAGIAFAASVRSLSAQSDGVIRDTADIRTVGNATETVRPDRATLTVTFSAEGATPSAANEKLAVRVDSIRTAVGRFGVARDSVISASGAAWWGGRIEQFFVSRTIRNPDPRPRGGSSTESITVTDTLYRARESCEIRINDIAKVGPVIDAVVALNVKDIQNIAFSRADSRAVREAVLKAATLDARAQAEIIASASGGRLGRAVSLSTSAPTTSRPGGFSLDEVVSSGASTRIRSAEAATNIAPPPVTVTATVYARWLLLPKP